MAIQIKLYDRLLPILQMISRGVSDIQIIKQQYSYICDKEWKTTTAFEKAFSRDIKLLIVSGLIIKENSYLKATRRTKNISSIPNIVLKNEIFKIYINSAHMYMLDGEHESTISDNLAIYDQLVLQTQSNNSTLSLKSKISA